MRSSQHGVRELSGRPSTYGPLRHKCVGAGMRVGSCWARSPKNQMIAFHFRDLKATVMPHPAQGPFLAKCLCPFICSLCDIVYIHILDGPIS